MILDFALRYDPQPFHLDVEAARASNYGGLIASGFQTMALGFRVFLDLASSAPAAWARPGSTSCAGRARAAGRHHPQRAHRQRDPPVALEADRGMLMTSVRVPTSTARR